MGNKNYREKIDSLKKEVDEKLSEALKKHTSFKNVEELDKIFYDEGELLPDSIKE